MKIYKYFVYYQYTYNNKSVIDDNCEIILENNIHCFSDIKNVEKEIEDKFTDRKNILVKNFQLLSFYNSNHMGDYK